AVERREFAMHLPGTLAHRVGDEKLPSRWQLDRLVDGAWVPEGALIRDPEFAGRLEFVANEFASERMLGLRREHLEHPATPGGLAPPGHEVNARVGEGDETAHELGEVVSTATDRQRQRLERGETGEQWLQCGTHRGDEDKWVILGT